jgi:hypothetical protein
VGLQYACLAAITEEEMKSYVVPSKFFWIKFSSSLFLQANSVPCFKLNNIAADKHDNEVVQTQGMVETQAAACVERQLVKGLENVTILSL